MRNKQNNDSSQKSTSSLSHEPPIKTRHNPLLQQKLKSVIYTDSITFKQAVVPQLIKKDSLPVASKEKPQLKSTSVTTSIIRQQVSTTLPITIHQLQQKTLNQYLKQFMQISTFQSVQKGKQLIDLVKQSPSSKQSLWVVNKLFKLFKSNIPQAVLCSFQFIRELIQIGSDKIQSLIEENLLMLIVEIIQYRSYISNMQRGNSYFLNSFYRYGPDQKTNHLIKISSTFFKMVHQALYVWGTLYFPQSNFNKMLNKLINSSKITFPSYPDEFKFYSQARIDLFLTLLQNRKQKVNKSQQKIKVQIKGSKLIKEKKDQANNEKSQQQKIVLKSKQKIQPNKQIDQKQKIKSPLKQDQNKKLQSLKKTQINNNGEQIKSPTKSSSPQSKQKQLQKREQSNASKQTQQNKHFKNKQTDYNNDDEDQLQCISFTRKQKPIIKQTIMAQQDLKVLQEYKKSKPTKVKQKKVTIINGSKKQIKSQKSIVISHLKDVEDPLNLLQQKEKQKIKQINAQKTMQVQKPQTIQIQQYVNKITLKKQQPKQSKQSKQTTILKQSLKLDLKKLTTSKQKHSIHISTKQKQFNKHIINQTHPLNNNNNNQQQHQQYQHTFRPIQKQQHQKTSNNNSNQPNNNSSQHRQQSQQQPQTARIQQTTQRQRFNYSMTQQSQDRVRNTLSKEKSNPNSDRVPQTASMITQFLKKQFQTLKNTLILQIKKDIKSTFEDKQLKQEQHLKFVPQKQIINQTLSNHDHHVKFQKLVDNLITNTNHQNQDPFSGRFGTKSQQQIQPSIQAMDFVKKKLSNGKKLRAVSKRKRHSIVKDLQPNQKQNQLNQNQMQFENHKEREKIALKKITKQKLVDSAVNTDEITNEKLYQQLSSLRQKLNLATVSKQNTIKKQQSSSTSKRQNAFFSSKLHSNSFTKTPFTINKNQEEHQKSSQFQSLRSTINSARKRSNSKLSQRRSSVESLIMQKALLRPQNCHNQLQQIFGGPNTLLYNAALNSVKKKRPSIMFC